MPQKRAASRISGLAHRSIRLSVLAWLPQCPPLWLPPVATGPLRPPPFWVLSAFGGGERWALSAVLPGVFPGPPAAQVVAGWEPAEQVPTAAGAGLPVARLAVLPDAIADGIVHLATPP